MAFYYTDSEGPDVEAVRLGVAYAVNLATAGQCGFAVHTKLQLDAPIFAQALGADAVRELRKDGHTVINRTMFLVTEKIQPRDFMRGPIVAIHIDPKFLQKIAQRPETTDLIYVPWLRSELHSVLPLHRGAQRIN